MATEQEKQDEANAAAEAEKAAAEKAAAEKAAAKPRAPRKAKVELGAEVDLGDKPGHLVFPDGGVSSHRGPARFTQPGEYRFVTATSEKTFVVEGK